MALLNSLRFGPLDDPASRYLFEGVVAGISGYGNCIGVPDVGGEVVFSPSYAANPLVNAMCVGLLRVDSLVHATTGGAGNLLMLVGADTGRDGIHGASGLASRSFEEERELRPTVQVGNPFLEKVLIEACLEAAQNEHVVGIQDLGAAGLTSASVEAASRAGRGVEIDVSLVPRRDTGMTPYEVMLSESQERMLVIVAQGHEQELKTLFDRWDLDSTVIGRVTNDEVARIYEGDSLRAEAPVRLLVDAPLYRPDGAKSERLIELQQYDLDSVPLPAEGAEQVLLRLLASPTIAAKQWIYRQYDHQVQTNTVQGPGGDAAVMRIKGTSRGIALATDGNGRLCYLDPLAGGMIAVAEACRNVSCTGAVPVALTDCLNFGNPERSDVYYQLEECIRGMARASEALSAPVVSGNASLYNESQGESIYPDTDRGRPRAAGRHRAPGRGRVHPARGRGRPAGNRWSRRQIRSPGGQRIPGAGPRPRGGQAVYRPRPRGQATEGLREADQGGNHRLGTRLLGWRPGSDNSRVLHTGRHGFRRSVRARRPVGLGALRRDPVACRRLPVAGTSFPHWERCATRRGSCGSSLAGREAVRSAWEGA